MLTHGPAFDLALGEFAQAYADQNEQDYQALTDASGRVGSWPRLGCRGNARRSKSSPWLAPPARIEAGE